jgi:2-keto-4-pentenoate hydratase/2-oxohepta-3-ene-1,7-dioic acid hydratase in catechol pathway
MRLAYLAISGRRTVAIVSRDGTYIDALGILAAVPGGVNPPPDATPLSVALHLRPAVTAAWEHIAREGRLADFILPGDTLLLPPIPRPNRILAIGRNYADHAKELGNAVPEDPIVFLKASTSVIGPGAAIEIPDWVGRVDYEAELLVVIGTSGKNIAEADAMEHVVGYSVFNDVTARERQRADQEKRQPWFRSKSMDTFGPLGPYLATSDEITDPHDRRITLSVNGETRQDDTTASMIYRIPTLIAYLSRWFALEPGDVIATGTPSGVGPIRPGDIVEATVEGVGTLRNPVIAA